MSTRTDAVCLALIALWTPLFTDVQVADGPQANSDPTADWLFVAYDGERPTEANQVIAAQQEWMAGAKVKKETADITCALVVVSGDDTTSASRARADSPLGTAEDALRADPTPGR